MGLLINGQSLSDLVAHSIDQRGHLTPTVPRRDVVDRGDGAPAWTSRLIAGERVIEQVVQIRPATLADRVSVLDQLRERCQGVCALTITDAPDRRWWALLDALTVDPIGPVDALPVANVTLRWRCQDARAEALEPTILALSTTPVTCPLGASASAPVVTVFGAATPVVDPVVVLTYGAGAREARLALTVTLDEGQSITLDGAREAVWLTSGGTTTSALATVDAGLWPTLDPADAPCTLRLESTSGTPTGVVRYRRMW